MKYAIDPKAFESNYGKVKADPGELWKRSARPRAQVYQWDRKSTYIPGRPSSTASR